MYSKIKQQISTMQKSQLPLHQPNSKWPCLPGGNQVLNEGQGSAWTVCCQSPAPAARDQTCNSNISCIYFSCSCKRISYHDPLNWSLSTSNDWPLCSPSSRLSSPLQNFLNHHCSVCLLAVPGSNAFLMLLVVSAVLQRTLNSNKKIT